MKRAIARRQTLWLRLFVLSVVAGLALPDVPWSLDLPVKALLIGLAFVRAPRSETAPVEVAPPVRGRWVARR